MKFIASHNLSTAEAFVLGQRAGLDPALVLDVIGDSAASGTAPGAIEAHYERAAASGPALTR
jgi:3-hydroxyisobutyrate dehydrogenase-like beta-hydroxyacid dehydrogenase